MLELWGRSRERRGAGEECAGPEERSRLPGQVATAGPVPLVPQGVGSCGQAHTRLGALAIADIHCCHHLSQDGHDEALFNFPPNFRDGQGW